MPVIAKRDNITFVMLADGEYISEMFDNPKVVVMRRGASTKFEVVVIKPLGERAKPEDLQPALPPACEFTQETDGGNPIHQHIDGSWWFYEQNFQMENGPYESWDECFECLTTYCELLQEVLDNNGSLSKESLKEILTEDSDDGKI